MPVNRIQREDYVLALHDLSFSKIEPNLEIPRWRLKDGQASILIGKDVLTPETFQPDPGRRPIGVSIPEADRPLTTVEAIEAEVLSPVRIRGVIETQADTETDNPADPQSLHESRRRYRSIGSAATYGPAAGELVDSGALAGYAHRSGDRIAIREPLAIKGVHSVLAVDHVNSRLYIDTPHAAQIGPGVSNGGPIDAFIAQGAAYIWITPDPLSSNPRKQMLVKSPDLYDLEGPFSETLKGDTFHLNQDFRVNQSEGRSLILSSYSTSLPVTVETWAQEGDALSFDTDPSFYRLSKFNVLDFEPRSLKGLLLSNGRKFWLVSDNTLSLLFDLGSDDYLGSKWRISRIARDRFLMVTEKFPPRVFKLSLRAGTVLGEESLAGLIPPRKPGQVEAELTPDVMTNPSWGMNASVAAGDLDSGVVRVLVRAVNIEENLYSDFVEVVDNTGHSYPDLLGTSLTGTVAVADGSIKVFAAIEANATGQWGPYIHPRMTHIEVWRTPAGADVFYRESLIEVASFTGNEFSSGAAIGTRFGTVVADVVGTTFINPLRLSNPDVLSLLALSQTEFESGGLPPICRDIVSLLGVTLCFGRAINPVNPTVQAILAVGLDGAHEMDGVSPLFYTDRSNPTGTPTLDLTGVQAGDKLIVLYEGDGSQVLNGDFSSTAFWSAGSGWIIAAGHALHTSGGGTNALSSASPLRQNMRYTVKFTISNRTAGSLDTQLGTTSLGSQSSNGTFTLSGVSNGTALQFVPTNLFDGEVDNVFVYLESPLPSASGATGKILPKGTYDILAVTVNGGKLELVHDVSLNGLVQSSHIKFMIVRDYVWPWPVVQSDEDVWYSRTDKFSPEGFPPRVLSLSTIGDVFRRAVVVKDSFAVAVMDQGVHLLYLANAQLLKETVDSHGAGTPWPDSVIVRGNQVFWATQHGIRQLTVNDNPDINGKRGNTTLIGETSMRNWFYSAYLSGEVIDAGYDEENDAFRFRRKMQDGSFQTLHYSFKYEQWTLLDDDNGLRYVASRSVENVKKPRLYSVDEKTGSVFACRSLFEESYPGSAVKGVVIQNQFTTTSIHQVGAFSSKMVGDVIRFPQAVRTILTATPDDITFDPVTLMAGDIWTIGASRFRCRFAPFLGTDRKSAITLHGLVIRARAGLPGRREGRLLARCYTNCKTPVGEDQEVLIFDPDESGRASIDRVLSLEAQGEAIELELECSDPRTDFRLEFIEAQVREDIEGEAPDQEK